MSCMDSMHLKRQKLITEVAHRSSVEAQAKELRRKYYLSQRKPMLETLVGMRKLKK